MMKKTLTILLIAFFSLGSIKEEFVPIEEKMGDCQIRSELLHIRSIISEVTGNPFITDEHRFIISSNDV